MLLCRVAGADAWELSGHVGLEWRGFWQAAQDPAQRDASAALAVKPEFYHAWDDHAQSLLIVPFARLDSADPRRSHLDLREFTYLYAAESFELRLGLRRVFWGVAESNHLIDIINQTDLIENLDGEDKFGQPMVNLALVREWGTVDLFVLPGFRERSFPGRTGRLRTRPAVADERTHFDSAAENAHVDWALRYAHAIGPFDIGLAHFWGTNREPRLTAFRDRNDALRLEPHYDLIHQTSIDAQATFGSLLLKVEALRRAGQGEAYFASVGGFEHTFVGVLNTAVDVGLLGEYHFDERGTHAPTPFNRDVFAGLRLSANDAADSQLLAGAIVDLNGRANFFNLEASRRIGERWRLECEVRLPFAMEPYDPLAALADDDYVQLELLRYF